MCLYDVLELNEVLTKLEASVYYECMYTYKDNVEVASKLKITEEQVLEILEKVNRKVEALKRALA